MKRNGFSPDKLDKMKWTMAPLTIYLGLDQKIPGIGHHNYFLRQNFRDYSQKIFRNKVNLDQAYYYVNVVSRHNTNAAPTGGEAVYILVPVPDRRFKPDWSDRESIADGIIRDLSRRTGFPVHEHIRSKVVLDPVDWEHMFGLHRGSGLGLGHQLSQMAWFRPSNRDEHFRNLFYTGASTLPGGGIPMGVISSRLVTERIEKAYGTS
jgi:phytoene desaturase